MLFLLVPSQAGAFDVDFQLTPTTTQAAAHPQVTVSIARQGTDDEDMRDMFLDLPPGLIGNPEAVTKCSMTDFNADTCPATSEVGSVSTVASAVGLSLPPVTGTVYVLDPLPTDAGTLGIVLRPPAGIDKVFLINSIKAVKVGDDYVLRNEVTNMPRQVVVGGLIPVDITIQSLTLTLNATGSTGADFLTNPTGCTTATSNVRVVSYLDQEVTNSSSFDPTDCDQVPFTPSMAFSMSSNAINAKVSPTVTINVPGEEDPLRQSHIKNVHARFPPGVTLDILGAFGVTQCPIDQLEADNCPASSDIGDISVAVPVLPPDFTGDVYRVPPGPTDVYAFGAVLRGPRGLKAVARGGSFIDSVPDEGGFALRVNSDFLNLPQIPFTSFTLALTRKIFVNPPTCGTRQASATLDAYSGAVATVSTPYTVTGCYVRAKAASPLRVPLVPAYKKCLPASANETHGPPLASASCAPPVPESGSLTVGTPDANGQPAQSVGFEKLSTVIGDPSTPADEADVGIAFGMTDVRKQGDLSDYEGELRASSTLRLIDLDSGSTLDQPATVTDLTYEFDVPCAATASTTIGGSCSLSTTADALTPGMVLEGKRATWRLGQVQVFDGGPDGETATADNTVFARQGIFVP
jgi:hypothetical protein